MVYGYRWFTSTAGVIFVQEGGGAPYAPVLSPTLGAHMDHVREAWGPLSREAEAKTGAPARTIRAMIFRESDGDQGARNDRDHPPGLGLLQITSRSLYPGLTEAQVMDPERNVLIGAGFIATIMRHQGKAADLPSVASVFNAGGVGPSWLPHPETDVGRYPWGYHETRGHILAEVAASNYDAAQDLGDAVLLSNGRQLPDELVLRAMATVGASLAQLGNDAVDDLEEQWRRERLRMWEDEVTQH